MNSESEFEIQQPGLFCLRWLFNFVTVCRSATLYHNVLIWETAEKSVSAKTLREVSGILKKIIPTKQTWMPKCVGLFMGNIWIDKKGKYLFRSVHLFYLLFFQMLVWTIRILFTVFLFCPHVNCDKQASIIKMLAICLATLEKLPICIANQNSL